MIEVFVEMVVRMIGRVATFDMNLLVELSKDAELEKNRKHQN